MSDQYGPFATQVIPATVNEAPYILDGLLMNSTGKRIKEQYADTGGFTDLVFAATSLLGYLFIPRIRDFPRRGGRYHFNNIEEVQDHSTRWLWIYNNERPNIGIGGMTPLQKLKAA